MACSPPGHLCPTKATKRFHVFQPSPATAAGQSLSSQSRTPVVQREKESTPLVSLCSTKATKRFHIFSPCQAVDDEETTEPSPAPASSLDSMASPAPGSAAAQRGHALHHTPLGDVRFTHRFSVLEAVKPEEGTAPSTASLPIKKVKKKKKNKRSSKKKSSEQGPPPAVIFARAVEAHLILWSTGEKTDGLSHTLDQPGQHRPDSQDLLVPSFFDATLEELRFPTSLTASGRRVVHACAVKLSLYHASSGEGLERRVTVSKTGDFMDQTPTQFDGGRKGFLTYDPDVTKPLVKGFLTCESEEAKEKVLALLQGNTTITSSLQRCRSTSDALAAISVRELPPMPELHNRVANCPSLEATPCEYVDTPVKLAALAAVLEREEVFGFDVEAAQARSYLGLVCLLQISTLAKDYIVDPLAPEMWDAMALLRPAFASMKVVKVGFATGSCDVPSLSRDFGIVLVNVFDAAEAARALGWQKLGLVGVLERAGFDLGYDMAALKERYQKCDWRSRPLDADAKTYARGDAHFLIPLFQLLVGLLLETGPAPGSEQEQQDGEPEGEGEEEEEEEYGCFPRGSDEQLDSLEDDDDWDIEEEGDNFEDEDMWEGWGADETAASLPMPEKTDVKAPPLPNAIAPEHHKGNWKKLRQAILASFQVAMRVWQPRTAMQTEKVLRKATRRAASSCPQWTTENDNAFRKLWHWREQTAESLDENPYYILAPSILTSIAQILPTDMEGYRKVALPLSPVLGDCEHEVFQQLLQLTLSVVPPRQEEEERDVTVTTVTVEESVVTFAAQRPLQAGELGERDVVEEGRAESDKGDREDAKRGLAPACVLMGGAAVVIAGVALIRALQKRGMR
ncbi:unnamed protein product [Chrysoparadoxa australica]